MIMYLFYFLFKIYSDGLDLNVAEQKGILKQRAEAQIEQVTSFVLKNALRQKLNSLMFRRRSAGKEASDENKELVGTRVIPDAALACAAKAIFKVGTAYVTSGWGL